MVLNDNVSWLFRRGLFWDHCCFSFLLRVSILTRDIDIANRSVCPSVCIYICPSVRNVPVSDVNGLTHRHSYRACK